jgi:hypothetical protein
MVRPAWSAAPPVSPQRADLRLPAAGAADAHQRYAKLPDRIRPEDMITEQPARDPGDPTLGGRDANRDWMLRYAG